MRDQSIEAHYIIDELRNQLNAVIYENVKLLAYIRQMEQGEESEA